MVGRDQRADVGRGVERIADRDRVHARRERVDQRGRAPTTRRRHASRPCSPARCCRWRRAPPPAPTASRSASANTTIGALPPSSSWTGMRALRRKLHDATAGRRRSGERRHVDARRGEQRLADLGATGHDGECAVGEAGLDRQLGEADRRPRRRRRRFEDDRASGGERRPDLPDRHHEREVPRCDCGHDADRSA